MNEFSFIIFGSFLGVMISVSIICLFEYYREKRNEVKRKRNLDNIQENIEEYLKMEGGNNVN